MSDESKNRPTEDEAAPKQLKGCDTTVRVRGAAEVVRTAPPLTGETRERIVRLLAGAVQ